MSDVVLVSLLCADIAIRALSFFHTLLSPIRLIDLINAGCWAYMWPLTSFMLVEVACCSMSKLLALPSTPEDTDGH